MIFLVYLILLALKFYVSAVKMYDLLRVVLTCGAKHHERTISLPSRNLTECTKRESAVNSLGSPSPFHPLLLLLKLKVTVTSSGGQEDKSKSRDQLIQI